jgi:hypothetical protein
MAIANTTIQLRKSGATGNVPASLNYGELALNYADGKLYYKNASGTITYISSGISANSFATINANSSLILATSNTDTLSIAPGNNITVTANTTSKTISIALANTVTIANSLTVGSGIGGNITGANNISANTFTANSSNATPLSVNLTGGAGNQNAVIQITGANTKGGTGYVDFLNTNNQSGSSNTNIWFRLDSAGQYQIINSPYTQNIFNLDQAGNLSVPGSVVSGSFIQFGDGSKQYSANAALSNNQILAGLKSVSSTANITFDYVATANNGQGTNFKVGDDIWIGDINVADTMGLRGQQNVQNAYITFGNNDGFKLGRSGSGPLTYNGGFNATYIQFGDGSKQYTANAGGGGGSGGFTTFADTLGNTVSYTTNTTVKFVGGSGVLVVANSINPTSISISTIPGQQGLTADWGYVADVLTAAYDFGSNSSL